MARGERERHALSDLAPATIRTADAGDAAEMLSLFRSVLEERRRTVQTPSEVEFTKEEERGFIQTVRDDPDRLCLVAEPDGTVIGTVRAEAEPYRRTRHFADVQALRVYASLRRRDVAGRLLAALIAWARAHREIEKLGPPMSSLRTRPRSACTKSTDLR